MPSIRSWGRSALVPFNFSGSGQLDQDEAYEVFFAVPEAVSIIDELGMWVRFSEFWAPATAASSGGGSTSGSGGGSAPTSSSESTPSGGGATSGSESAHRHKIVQYVSAAVSTLTARRFQFRKADDSGNVNIDPLNTASGEDLWSYPSADAHSHTTPNHTHPTHNHTVTIAAHDHTTPNHVHGLTYGIFKETLPGSFNVQLTVYRRSLVDDDDGPASWAVIHQTNLTEQEQSLDLAKVLGNAYLGPGLWRLAFQSNGGQPNNGRLAVDVMGWALGSIASV